jgi:hypothetical protein
VQFCVCVCVCVCESSFFKLFVCLLWVCLFEEFDLWEEGVSNSGKQIVINIDILYHTHRYIFT